MKPARFVLALLSIALMSGCARLHRAEAINIAIRKAEREGAQLTEFKKPTASYRIGRDSRTWYVFFDGRNAMPGNHFFVEVDDQTGDATVRAGR